MSEIKLCDAPKYLEVSKLKFHPENPRTIEPDRLEDMKRSLLSKGVYKPILVWKKNNVILEGNHRVKAARALIDEGHILTSPKGQTQVMPVVVLDVDETMARKILIESNTTFAHWVDDLLRKQLMEAKSEGDDLRDYGLTDAQIEALLGDAISSADALLDSMAKEDEAASTGDESDEPVPPPPVGRSKFGEIYILGKNRLMCGDATDEKMCKALMGGDLADMVFTDPPYGVSLGMNETMKSREHRNRRKDGMVVANDDLVGEKLGEFLLKTFKNYLTISKAGAPMYVCHADSEGFTFRKAMMDSGYLYKQCLIWVKQQFVMGRQDYHWQHEPILYGWKPGDAHPWHGDRKQSTIWNFDRPSRSPEHPTMKPVELVKKGIENSSKEADLVVDFFGGSGSTLMAAEMLGRRGYSMELFPNYVDGIIERWEKYTGRDAYLLTKDGKKKPWKQVKAERGDGDEVDVEAVITDKKLKAKTKSKTTMRDAEA